MRRECKCHGLSGACNMQTCWLKLPPFREVASKLHDSLDQAIRVIYVPTSSTSRQKSATVKKSNKKRSSAASSQSVNGLARSSTSLSSSPALNLNSQSGASAAVDIPTSIVGSRRRGTKRHTSGSESGCEDCYRSAPVASGSVTGVRTSADGTGSAQAMPVRESDHTNADQFARDPPQTISSARDPAFSAAIAAARNSTLVKKRPVARSIGIAASTMTPSKFDLLYYEESPDFCSPSEKFSIKGTKGRICSESPNALNSCERLCCGRGYKTEVREEKYKCECQFKFCCKLECNTCTRRKVIHKCL